MSENFYFYNAGELTRKYDILQNSDLIEGLISGDKVSIISGGSKAGKSTLALDMAKGLSTGGDFLGMKCQQVGVLYISLDNDDDTIAQRIKLMSIQNSKYLQFYFNLPLYLGNENKPNQDQIQTTMMDVLEKAIISIPKFKVVFIDLLNNIRSLTPYNEYSNAKVYEDISYLRGLAKTYEIAIIALNHDTKQGSRSGYCASKGGVELTGTINGAYMHLIRNGIGETNATLEIGGRNIAEKVIQLQLDTETLTYKTVDDEVSDEIPVEIGLIRNYIVKKGYFAGTLSELLTSTKSTISAVKLGKLIKKYSPVLESEGITFYQKSSHKLGRIYVFEYRNSTEGDSGTDNRYIKEELSSCPPDGEKSFMYKDSGGTDGCL